MNKKDQFIRVAIPSPLHQYFDYLPPENFSPAHTSSLQFGSRVLAPFGTRQVIGFILAIVSETNVPLSKIKHIIQILDDKPLWPKEILELLKWTSNYYHYPLGEIFNQVLPPFLRKHPDQITIQKIRRSKKTSKATIPIVTTNVNTTAANIHTSEQNFTINQHQQIAIDTILRTINKKSFKTFLIDGVTGSGKTEVYLKIIAPVLEQGKQALILVPEINLTPQTVERFAKRFPTITTTIIHSQLNTKERFNSWLATKEGRAAIIIGTRSAIFTPMLNPGIIIIDEEHDQSFKQQSNLRYSARDLSIMRGKLENIPIVLGSATPSLESFVNATRQRYVSLQLPERAGDAIHPPIHLIDMRNQKIIDGLAIGLIEAIERHLKQQGQILIFLNCRGYAPILLCNSCGWIADCNNCDAHLTLHRKTQKLHCHHCGAIYDIPQICGNDNCDKKSLYALGLGTEKLESIVPKLFPGITTVRIDSDTTNCKGIINKMLATIYSGESKILIGTQMLAKGHHFPNVTMVAILNVDNGLFSSDFRASEHLAQLIMQVSGRAGRAERPGEVYIQTHHPHHPLLQRLIQHGYHSFAQAALRERSEAALPPFSHLALMRCESKNKEHALAFLTAMKDEGLKLNQQIKILGPTTAPMERKAGFYQAQLLFQSINRATLQQLLAHLVKRAHELKTTATTDNNQSNNSKNNVANSSNTNSKKVGNIKWSLDVDPIEMG